MKDVDAARRFDKYFVIEQFTGETYVVDRDGEIEVSLENEDVFRLYKFIPIKDGKAIVGLDGKFVSTRTVEEMTEDGFILSESGDFSFYSEKKPAFVRAGSIDADFSYNDGLCKVKAPESSEKMRVVIGY